ncbi:hypothetical protein HZH68_007078 [Vespula germanica]|uniref:Uncharacterized protein n=1 Tax=Vespula germanica TaxID=30212 RepID=A0A834K6S5_VESGE|nr:hypothetical protein HZH68_007078 [Vespula germanica]
MQEKGECAKTAECRWPVEEQCRVFCEPSGRFHTGCVRDGSARRLAYGFYGRVIGPLASRTRGIGWKEYTYGGNDRSEDSIDSRTSPTNDCAGRNGGGGGGNDDDDDDDDDDEIIVPRGP